MLSFRICLHNNKTNLRMSEEVAVLSAPGQQQTIPLLRPSSPVRPSRATSLLTRAAGGGRRSAVVRETAALQLEERRADWAHSKPVVMLDISWNLAFVLLSVVMIAATLSEKTNVPVRVWICGYAIQCAVHVVVVWLEYRQRRRSRGEIVEETVDVEGLEWISSLAKRGETINTLASFLWWIIGFYWVISGGEILMQDAPKLYWLTVLFLAFDVFFAIFCVALACVIGIALCCCLPCIIAILYAVAGQDGASDADISILPRYRYSEPSDDGKMLSVEEGVMIPIANCPGSSSSDQRVLLREDAECCICLASYEDGVELLSLPCNHHFHSPCIVKWLRINATCPLCKYNILKCGDFV